MSYAISPISKEGTRLIGAAESLIEPFRSRSYAADRANEIDAENYHDMQRVGIASAFVFGYLSIEFLLRYLRVHGTLIFVVYRVLLGATVLFLWRNT